MALFVKKPSVPNLNVAEPKDLSPSMRKLKEIREHILAGAVDIRGFIMKLYEEDSEQIEEDLNKSYKIADDYTNLCIEVVQEGHSSAHVKKIIDVLISLGANINRWNTANGKYEDQAENALTWAVTHNKGLIVQHLIMRGAEAEDAGDHSSILSHFAGHLSPKQTRKLRRALGGRTPTSAASSRMGSEGGGGAAAGRSREASAGGAPGGGGGGAAVAVAAGRSRAPSMGSGGGGAAGHGGIPKGTRSRGASISKRRTRKQK